MLSLTKKSETEPVAAPLWHPNFRNFERLPDTKVVRTTFFVNTAAIAITLGLVLLMGFREYRIYNLGEQIGDAQKQIDSNSRQNKEALRLTRIFGEEELKLQELAVFTKTTISPSEFVSLLGQSLPKEISVDGVEARLVNTPGAKDKGNFVLRGTVSGTPDQATGTASSYVDKLRAFKPLDAVFDPITLNTINRNAGNGFMSFEISLKVRSEPKEKK